MASSEFPYFHLGNDLTRVRRDNADHHEILFGILAAIVYVQVAAGRIVPNRVGVKAQFYGLHDLVRIAVNDPE